MFNVLQELKRRKLLRDAKKYKTKLDSKTSSGVTTPGERDRLFREAKAKRR